MDITLLASILTITLRAGTSLVCATVGEIYAERSGILNLGVEGMMMMGALAGFAVAYHTGRQSTPSSPSACVPIRSSVA